MNHSKDASNNESLSIGQLAEYLGWSTRFVEGLVRGERLPGIEIDGQWRFRRGDVIDWLEQKIQTLDSVRATELEAKMESSLLADGTFRTTRTDRLATRLPLDGISLSRAESSKDEVLRALVDLAEATGLLLDRGLLLSSLVDRESLCSTAVSGGVALCHPRQPIPEAIQCEFLCFLRTEQPVDFGAENGEGTSLFFLLVAPDDRSHLHGIVRLARILKGGGLGVLKSATTPEEIKQAFTDAENNITPVL